MHSNFPHPVLTELKYVPLITSEYLAKNNWTYSNKVSVTPLFIRNGLPDYAENFLTHCACYKLSFRGFSLRSMIPVSDFYKRSSGDIFLC